MIENRTDKLIIELTKTKLKGSLHDPLFGGNWEKFRDVLAEKEVLIYEFKYGQLSLSPCNFLRLSTF